MAAQNPPEPVASHDDLHAWMAEVFGRSVADMDPATAAQAVLAGVDRLGTNRLRTPKAHLTLADPPGQPLRYQLKVTLNHSKPPIWRRVSVPSDLTLDVFHDVVQAAMGWTNSHLHQFTTGDDRHGDHTETILTDWDIHEGEDGRPETDIRLDALVTELGDKLHYWYDFGDDWRHTIVLEKVEPRDDGDDVAACVAGRRACPPEDIGGPHFYSEIFDAAEDSDHPDHEWALEVVEDRALTREAAADFDVEAHDAAVRRVVGGTEALRRIIDNADDYPASITNLFKGCGHDAARFVTGFVADAHVTEPIDVGPDEARTATVVVRTFLDHVGEGGLSLTSAGYLRPADVASLMKQLDPERQWIGAATTEAHTQPLLNAREVITRIGLLRKYRGRLLLTRAGAQLRADPVGLWWHVARRLPVEPPLEGHDAAVFLLLRLASGQPLGNSMRDELNLFMAVLGWSLGGNPSFNTPDDWFNFTRRTQDVLGWSATGRVFNPDSHRALLESSHARLMARGALSVP